MLRGPCSLVTWHLSSGAHSCQELTQEWETWLPCLCSKQVSTLFSCLLYPLICLGFKSRWGNITLFCSWGKFPKCKASPTWGISLPATWCTSSQSWASLSQSGAESTFLPLTLFVDRWRFPWMSLLFDFCFFLFFFFLIFPTKSPNHFIYAVPMQRFRCMC